MEKQGVKPKNSEFFPDRSKFLEGFTADFFRRQKSYKGTPLYEKRQKSQSNEFRSVCEKVTVNPLRNFDLSVKNW